LNKNERIITTEQGDSAVISYELMDRQDLQSRIAYLVFFLFLPSGDDDDGVVDLSIFSWNFILEYRFWSAYIYLL
jgi:hypothetical protein